MNIPRRALFGKLNQTLFKSIESATSFAKLRGNRYVELVHWLHQIWHTPDGDLQRICRHFSINTDTLERDMSAALMTLPSGASSISDFSHHIENAIERAWVMTTLQFGDNVVRGAWLIAALIKTHELRQLLLGISPTFKALLVEGLSESLVMIIEGSPESNEKAHDGSSESTNKSFTTENNISSIDGTNSNTSGVINQSTLAKYCNDLTLNAKNGKIDPVVGREDEIRNMVDILLRRRQNNPLLTGDAGVGKTAVVEGLAQAIADNKVPPALAQVRLLSLDVGALLAGASMKGEFESRLKALLDDATKSPRPIILFIDEIHTLVGAGGQAGTGDAVNLLKPALARGNLRTIGATTWSEYKRHIEKDPALTRRFQVLQVMEPEEAKAVHMVRGLVEIFSKHHQVQILDESVRSAVRLSHRYIPSRQLPDKAISLLDTACARVAMSLHSPPAQVEDIRQHLATAKVELKQLQQEASIGYDRHNLIINLENKLAQIISEQEKLENLWQSELHLCNQIIELKQKLVSTSITTTNSEKQATKSLTDQDNLLSTDQAPTEEPDLSSNQGLNEEERSKILDQLRLLENKLAILQKDGPLIFPEVNETVVGAVVSDWTGIPIGRMLKDEVALIRQLSDNLGNRVIGQQEALNLITRRVQVARTNLADPKKPVGVFLLCGPSGVGKTETALALAEALYGGESSLIVLNMSEYQEAHTISTLKGSPPGYVGYGEGGVLTEAVRRRPYSVILLDEIEKAHRDVHEVFYQVFDKGQMEDGEGRLIDFKNTLILATSNVGAELISQLTDDRETAPTLPVLAEAISEELRKVFPAAFIGRMSVVPYLPLVEESLANIVKLHLSHIAVRLHENHQIFLQFDQAVVQYIVNQCGAHETGARHLISYIEQNLLPELSGIWLDASENKFALKQILLKMDTKTTTILYETS